MIATQIFVKGAELEDESHAETLEYNYENDGTGIYNFQYKTSNGIEREEKTIFTNENGRGDHYVLSGYFSYRGPDGVDYKVKYTADKDGFHPEGDHFTVPPYTPWNVQYDENGEEIYSASASSVNPPDEIDKNAEAVPDKKYLPARFLRRT